MQFHFQKNLDYQQDAIKVVVDIFETGKNAGRRDEFKLLPGNAIVSNALELDEERMLQNMQAIQKMNGIEEVSEKIGSMDFSIEMETGTGKTYVYLRTMMELAQKYGLKKFIILVPSVAIREGVCKTIEQTKKHFKELYNFGYGSFAYDSGKLSQVREFVQSNDVQVMVTTIQSFNGDRKVMKQATDKFHGNIPIELVAQTRPVIIMDEPQNMESELSKSAIGELNSLFRLRYSATHKEKHNVVYRLTPVDAYKQRLVKRIEVFGVKDDDAGAFVFNVRKIVTEKGKLPRAEVEMEIKNTNGNFETKLVKVKDGDDLYRLGKQNEKYAGLFVELIDAVQGGVMLSDRTMYKVESANEENKEQIFRTQIRETIKTHIAKQARVGDRIKVLSLFFIDKVDNYVHDQSLVRTIFEEEFEKAKHASEFYKEKEASAVHKGYFASKKKKGGVIEFKDSTGRENGEDREAFNLIMKEKERLLSFSEPTSFIFSHSALREGWDNPNVFQICTLNETQSNTRKRQEIGRGLRLPVDVNGERVYDEAVNILTVIANQSYQSFVADLQKDFKDAGYANAAPVSNTREKVKVTFKKHLSQESAAFQELWKRIQRKTKYSVEVDSERLLWLAVDGINELDLNNLIIIVERVMIDFDNQGKLKSIHGAKSAGERLNKQVKVGNVVERIAKETGLTRQTVFAILDKVENFSIIFENQEEYIRSVIIKINSAKEHLMLEDGLRYIPTGDMWEMSIFGDFESYKAKLVESKKSVFDYVAFDSEGEREFAQSLDSRPEVVLFTKLPSAFVVDTPLGSYNPDWAIVIETDQGEKLYLVRETKFVDDIENLRPTEKIKILCGMKHFAALDVDFKVAKSKNLEDLR